MWMVENGYPVGTLQKSSIWLYRPILYAHTKKENEKEKKYFLNFWIQRNHSVQAKRAVLITAGVGTPDNGFH